MKPLLSSTQLITHMKEKGIGFNIVSEKDAIDFLDNNNYYMKLSSYRFLYKKYPEHSKNSGKYMRLEFAYLQELSTIDMYLRYLILEMCLDIEHCIKVKLINHVSNNPEEDGYDIIRQFINTNDNKKILSKIKNHTSSDYCKSLIEKYHPYYPIWVFVEVISFGDIAYLCDFYRTKYGYRIIENKFLNTIRDMRNASAHSNCLINKLFDKIEGCKIDAKISRYVKDKGLKTEKLRYRVVYDFVTLIYVYDMVISEGKMKTKRFQQLKDLFNDRMTKNKDYFKDNLQLLGIYNFTKKIIDKL